MKLRSKIIASAALFAVLTGTSGLAAHALPGAPTSYADDTTLDEDVDVNGGLTRLPGATEYEATEGAALSAAVMIDGKMVPIDQAVKYQSLHADDTAKPDGEVSPKLIDLNQWTRCYVFNEMDAEFAFYTFYWDGAGHDIRLKCGTSGWGYKHIQEGHQDDWQAKYDDAIESGWNPASQGLNSWDDLMHAAVATITAFPNYVGGNSLNQTQCGVSYIYFINVNTGIPAYSFRARAAWATNSDRLITAFPAGSQVC